MTIIMMMMIMVMLITYLIFVRNARNAVSVKFLAECKKIPEEPEKYCFGNFFCKFTHFPSVKFPGLKMCACKKKWQISGMQFHEIRFDPIFNGLALLHFLVETFSPHIFGGPRLQTSPLSNPISTQFVEYVGYQNYGACWNDPKTILFTSVNVGHTKQKKEFEIKTNNVLNNPAIPM